MADGIKSANGVATQLYLFSGKQDCLLLNVVIQNLFLRLKLPMEARKQGSKEARSGIILIAFEMLARKAFRMRPLVWQRCLS
ncbi:hypothetical protein CXF63_11215 [Psychrobacter sp. Choline-3u-12]|nr:hypothetical protein CXF63_11215 [Psychrobacter sp. Choline-3u-12]